MHLGNYDRMNWRNINVDDGVQVMDAIRKLQGEYGLVMVGRRHSDMSLREEVMVDFVHNPELGVIGDMLASSDFCDGMMNVLVLLESKKSKVLWVSAYSSKTLMGHKAQCWQCSMKFRQMGGRKFTFVGTFGSNRIIPISFVLIILETRPGLSKPHARLLTKTFERLVLWTFQGIGTLSSKQ